MIQLLSKIPDLSTRMLGHFTAGGLCNSCDQLQQRGLPGTVRSQNGKPVAPPQGEIEVLQQGRVVSIGTADIV